MTEVFRRPVHNVNQPLYVSSLRWCNYDYEAGKRYPWDMPARAVPQGRRVGLIQVTYALTVAFHTPQLQTAYPQGAHWESNKSVTVTIMVIPQGSHARSVEEYLKYPPFTNVTTPRMRQLRTQQTLVAVGQQAEVSWGQHSVFTDAHLTLVEPKQFGRFLPNMLQHIGIHRVDVAAAEAVVKSQLAEGYQRLQA